jgi:hypothetical protein
LSEREVCFGGSTNWFGTLPAQAWEDFICPNHDPDRNRPFYLIHQLFEIFWINIASTMTCPNFKNGPKNELHLLGVNVL